MQKVPFPRTPIPQKLYLARRKPSWHARSRPIPGQPNSGQTSTPDGCCRSLYFSSSRRGRSKRETPCRDTSLSSEPNKSLGKGEGVREGERENRFSKRVPSPPRIIITSPIPPKTLLVQTQALMARKVSPDSRPARLWTNKQAGRLLPFGLLFFIPPGDAAGAKRLAGTCPCRVSPIKVWGKERGCARGRGRTVFQNGFPLPLAY